MSLTPRPHGVEELPAHHLLLATQSMANARSRIQPDTSWLQGSGGLPGNRIQAGTASTPRLQANRIQAGIPTQADFLAARPGSLRAPSNIILGGATHTVSSFGTPLFNSGATQRNGPTYAVPSMPTPTKTKAATPIAQIPTISQIGSAQAGTFVGCTFSALPATTKNELAPAVGATCPISTALATSHTDSASAGTTCAVFSMPTVTKTESAPPTGAAYGVVWTPSIAKTASAPQVGATYTLSSVPAIAKTETAPPISTTYAVSSMPPITKTESAPPVGATYAVSAMPPITKTESAPPVGATYAVSAMPPITKTESAPPVGATYAVSAMPPITKTESAPPVGATYAISSMPTTTKTESAPLVGTTYAVSSMPPLSKIASAPAVGATHAVFSMPVIIKTESAPASGATQTVLSMQAVNKTESTPAPGGKCAASSMPTLTKTKSAPTGRCAVPTVTKTKSAPTGSPISALSGPTGTLTSECNARISELEAELAKVRAISVEKDEELRKLTLELGQAETELLWAHTTIAELAEQLKQNEDVANRRASDLEQELQRRCPEVSPQVEKERSFASWNAFDQLELNNCGAWREWSANHHIDSPSFALAGAPGFYLRFWPAFLFVEGEILSCLKLFGPHSIGLRCRLGIGDWENEHIEREDDFNILVNADIAGTKGWCPSLPSDDFLRCVWVEVWRAREAEDQEEEQEATCQHIGSEEYAMLQRAS